MLIWMHNLNYLRKPLQINKQILQTYLVLSQCSSFRFVLFFLLTHFMLGGVHELQLGTTQLK